MAERTNQNATIRQNLGDFRWYDYDPIYRIRDLANPDYPLRTRLWDMVENSVRGYVTNLNPIGRERAWYIGAGIALAESYIFMNGVTGHRWQDILIKAGINIAITQGASFVGRYLSDSEGHIRIGSSLIALRFADSGGREWGKQLSKGLAAGGFFGSLGMGMIHWAQSHPDILGPEPKNGNIPVEPARPTVRAVNTPIVPRPTMTVEPTRIPATQAPTIAPTLTVEPTRIPPTPTTSNALNKVMEIWQNRAIMGDNGDYLGQLAGEKIQLQDTLIDKALQAQGKSIRDLSPTALSAAREAVKKALETQVNLSADQAIHTASAANPNLDTASLAGINGLKGSIKNSFDIWFNDAQHQTDLSGVALRSINQQPNAFIAPGVPSGLPSFTPGPSFVSTSEQLVNQLQTHHPEYFIDHVVKKGETAGHFLLDMGLKPTWDGTDWQAFAVLREMNPGLFTELRTAMGLTPDQFTELLQKIQAGGPDGKEAYATLIKYMGRIEAGKHIKLLSSQAKKALETAGIALS